MRHVLPRIALLLAALGAALAATALALASSQPAAAASSPCGKKVLADWYDNGRIDRIYPPHCYEDAIDAIPKDLDPYIDAEEVISRALASALRGQLDEGGCDPTPDGSDNDCAAPGGGTSNGGTQGGGTKNDGKQGGSKKNNGNNGKKNNGGTTTTTTTTTGSEAVPDIDTSATTSVPVPLLVLGGMSMALLAAGGLGFVSRRRHGLDDEATDDPLR